jgi:putative hemolysin
LDRLLILAVIGANGLFSMTELAVVSARRSRLQSLVERGRPGAALALGLQEEPGRFLSTIQVGITLVGILSGAIGQTVLAAPLATKLAALPPLAPFQQELALALVVIGITYLSVVFGELVPKRVALLAPERIASLMAAPMLLFAKVAVPLVWVFSISSEALLRALGARRPPEPPVTNTEIEILMAQGAEAGIFHASEQALVANVLHLDELPIGAIMTPRIDIEYLDLAENADDLVRRLRDSDQSRIVVCRGGLENVLGSLDIVDLFKQSLAAQHIDLEAIESCLRPALYVPRKVSATHLLEQFRRSRQEFALVVNEYGDIHGVVTLTDVLTSIVGDIVPSRADAELSIAQRVDGSWLIDGGVSIERVKTHFGIERILPGQDDRSYHTLGGFLMHELGRIPRIDDTVAVADVVFEVVDMDGNRVDKVLARRAPVPPTADEAHED